MSDKIPQTVPICPTCWHPIPIIQVSETQTTEHALPFNVRRHASGTVGLTLFETEHEALEAAWKLRNAEIERLQGEINVITKRIAEIEIRERE